MNNVILKYSLLFLICILAQVLIFNPIELFNVAFPIFFIYFLVRLPMNTKLSLLFTLAFFLGLIIDIFSDTPGVNALACTLIASIRQPIYYAYVDKDDHTRRLIPSVSTLGITDYAKFLLTFVGIYCVLMFIIEYFSFADVESLVIMASSSTLLTFIILLAVDCLIPSKT
ncbi:MAG: rod shape-determining protein MreD [Muribaculaceae bacterium]|nr:rod shape-determining protein MreD [Muribaculaceae bacterium]